MAAKKKSVQLKSSTTKQQRPYPARTLEEALAIPQAIRDKNNGNPWATDDVAQAALGVRKNNNKFFYAAAAARDYGLTVGTRDTEKIELGTLGRDIVFAGDEITKRQKMIDAVSFLSTFLRESMITTEVQGYLKKNFLVTFCKASLDWLRNFMTNSLKSLKRTANF